MTAEAYAKWRLHAAASMSGYGTEADVARTRESGFAEHLTKPVDLETLLEAIESVSAAWEAGLPASALTEAPGRAVDVLDASAASSA